MDKKTNLSLTIAFLFVVYMLLGMTDKVRAAIEIVNGGFELPAGIPWAQAEGWSGKCRVNVNNRGHRGNNAETKDATSLVYQDINAKVIAGRTYTLSFYRKQLGSKYHNGNVSMDAQLIFDGKVVASTGPITRDQVKPRGTWNNYTISYVAGPKDTGKFIQIAFDIVDLSELAGSHGREKYGHAYAMYDTVTLTDGTPVITNVSPSFADSAKGGKITIHGSDLDAVTQIEFGDSTVPASTFISQSKNQIILPAPSHAEEVVDVKVTNPLGTFILHNGFKYKIPTIFYVAPNGSDSNPGTKSRPFKTVQKVASTMDKGDICYVRSGRYYEEVNCDYREGLNFISYPGEDVIFDGTAEITDIKKSGSNWTVHSGSIYKIKLDQDIWQFFYRGKMMTAARWPNDDITSDAAWTKEDKKGWAFGIGGKDYAGQQYTDTSNGKPSLAATGKDFTGAMAILNLGAWLTLVAPVTSHTACSNEFTYDPKLFDSWAYTTPHVIKSHSYYLECHLSAIDMPGEWYYDRSTKELYFMPPGAKAPDHTARGRIRDYAFSGKDSKYITLKGFKFLGCTINFSDAEHLTIKDFDFISASYSKRMLGKTWDGSWTHIKGPRIGSYNSLRNCTFSYCDGSAIRMEGGHDLIENVLIHDCDWSVIMNAPIHIKKSSDSIVRRVTVYNTGSSEAIQVGPRNIVELCDFGQGIGGLEDDGACIQVSPPQMEGTIIRNNWVHDNNKFGIRGDFYPNGPVFGKNMNVHHNVVWGLQAKLDHKKPAIHLHGNANFIYNNLSFNNSSRDICLPVHKSSVWNNSQTIICNNLTGPDGIGIARVGVDDPPGIVGRNIEYPDESNMPVMNQNICDFRPKRNSRLIDKGKVIPGVTDGFIGKAPDIGAYEYGDKNYWIPGYQTRKASRPIPSDKFKYAKLDTDIIWLEGYKATLHDIYFGTDFNAVAKANHDFKEYKGRQANNIFSPGKLKKGKTYYWRIDAIGKTGEVVTGDVWGFTVNPLLLVQLQAKQDADGKNKRNRQAKEIIVLANRAFRRGGYDNYKECVKLCRKVLQDYSDTRYANHARRLLRRIPLRYRQDFKITKKEMGR